LEARLPADCPLPPALPQGDVYVHAELHGASSTIIKNPQPDQPVPPLSLQQAGAACV
jgi:predicted ribosome quality control (RQC) complex YloA/Tae2 family protein